jgi:peptidoglycan/xylan/chitin deacetylase (PgdA/CDA1 family)
VAHVHLSFDNGPHPEGTPLVLETLAAHSATASFFVLGKHLATEPGAALAREVVAAGHRLGHHSWSHEVPLGEDPRPEAISVELQATHDRLRELWTGPRWFRPFGGGGHLGPHLFSPAALRWLARERYTAVLWSSVPGDWKDPEGWVERALDDAADQEQMVLVLHDIVPAAMQQLDTFLHRLQDAGHRLTDAFPESILPMVEGAARPGLELLTQRPQPPS